VHFDACLAPRADSGRLFIAYSARINPISPYQAVFSLLLADHSNAAPPHGSAAAAVLFGPIAALTLVTLTPSPLSPHRRSHPLAASLPRYSNPIPAHSIAALTLVTPSSPPRCLVTLTHRRSHPIATLALPLSEMAVLLAPMRLSCMLSGTRRRRPTP